MKQIQPNYSSILAIDPSSRGFGFALLEGEKTLVEWGVKYVEENKNNNCLVRVRKLISDHQPEVIALPDCSKEPQRCARIRILVRRIAALAARHNVKVVQLSREQVKQCFSPDGQITKYGIAEIIANRFHQELGHRLPPKRKLWKSEDSRMDIFDAVALGLVCAKVAV